MTLVRFFFGSVLAWQVALGLVQVMLPLYAYELGFSSLAIGSLISLPMVVQFVMRIVGGAAADRWGERTVLIVSFVAMGLSGPLFFTASGYWALLLAQGAVMFSRAIFFLSAQTLISRFPGRRSELFGRLGAVNQGGRIVGVLAAGFLYEGLGFRWSALVITLLAAAALLLILGVPGGPAVRERHRIQWLQHYRGIFRLRALYFAVTCSFVAAVPATLVQSFYPVYLAAIAYSGEWIGAMSTGRSAGAVLFGLFLARFVTRSRRLRLALAGIVAVALTVAVTPLFTAYAAIGLLLLIMGGGGLLMDIHSQTVATEFSRADQRGATMGLAGYGWILSHTIVPLVFGAVADAYGLQAGFYVWGALLLLLGILVVTLHRWAFAQAPPGQGAPGQAPAPEQGPPAPAPVRR